jgi:hypothetical protein
MESHTISSLLHAGMDRDDTDSAIYSHVLHIDGPGAVLVVDGNKRDGAGWPLVTIYPCQDAYEAHCNAVYSKHLPAELITYLRRMAWLDER